MEISAEDPFRIRSYRTAAGVIEGYPEQLSAILKDPAKKLTDIAGIGKGIAAVVAEIEERGSFERRDEMLGKYPASLLELLSIQGLGSKSIRLLYDTYKVQSIDDLEQDLPRAEAAGAAADGGEARRESAAVDCVLPADAGAVPAFVRAAGGGGIDRVPEARCPAWKRSRRRGVCGARRKRWAIWICWSRVPARRRRWRNSWRIPRRMRCWARVPTRPASNSGWKGCRWICARWRRRVTARRCCISPGAKSTTLCCARARRRWA